MSHHADQLPRYRHLRQIGLEVNNRLVRTLSRSVLDEGGHQLGILKGNSLLLDAKDEIDVFVDYCIYDVRRRGKNAVERFLKKSPPALGSDEWVILNAMRQARYSVFAVESQE
jgi:hypothetical protein